MIRNFFLTALILFSFFVKSQKLINIGTNVNSPYNELSPVISPDGSQLYFHREGHPQNGNQQKYSLDIWLSSKSGDTWMPAYRLNTPFNNVVINNLYSVSTDGNTMVTNWTEEDETTTTNMGFGIITKSEDGWSAPKKLAIQGFEKMCKGRYQHGYLSVDGKTFLMSFSEKKKSKVDDIYVSFMNKQGQWSSPMNLGDEINTDSTETIPFLAPDGATLYFSSNRAGGYGSNDIWVSKRLDKTWQKWSKPKNMGSIINSRNYEGWFTLSATSDMAYMVSNNASLGKNDLVQVNLNDLEQPIDPNKPSDLTNNNDGNKPGSKTGTVGTGDNSEKDPSLLAEPVVVLSGKIIDPNTNKVPTGAKVIFEDLDTGQEIGISNADPKTGEYKLVLPYGRKYGIIPIADGFIGAGKNLDLTQKGAYVEIKDKNLNMIPAAEGSKLTLSNLFFEFGKTDINEKSYTELRRIIDFMKANPSVTVEISGHTDNIGTDEINYKISQGRADAVKKYLISEGKISFERITAKGYGKTKPVADNSTEEGQAANRRVEFLILKAE